MLYNEYINILIYIIVALIFSFILFFISYLVDFFFFNTRKNFEKLSSYECGFQPFGDARNTFDIRFYLVAILFMIFDLEIAFIFPWVLTIVKTNIIDILVMLIFLFILTLGFFYEWYKGALEWQ